MTTAAPPKQPTQPSGPAPEPPHPCIRARRIEVRRDEGRRRRQRLIVLAAVLAVACLAAALTRSPALDVDHVIVTGAAHSGPATVARTAGLQRRQPMTEVDGRAARSRIRTLPWVADVSVRRQWPGTVEVHITEREAVAQVASASGGWAAVDRTGHVLQVTRTGFPGLVRIDRLTAAAPGSVLAAGAGAPLRLATMLPAALAAGVAAITTHPGGDLTLRLIEGDIEVNFGAPSELTAKVQALEALLASAVREPPIKTIDVSVPSASVLTRERGRA